jgi:hypothetical protein
MRFRLIVIPDRATATRHRFLKIHERSSRFGLLDGRRTILPIGRQVRRRVVGMKAHLNEAQGKLTFNLIAAVKAQ